MHYFKEYREYLKDNPNGYWFRRKLYGWGWTPVRWQGWLVILAFVAVLVFNGLSLSLNSMDEPPTDTMIMWFVIKIVLTIALLLFICYKKGERPRWQWGTSKKD